MKIRILILGLCLVTVAAFGQANPKLKDLNYFVGTWQCTGTSFASPMGPEHPTKATITAAWILGGTWLEAHYKEAKAAKNPTPFELRAFWGYDEEPKSIVAGTVDNMGGYSTAAAAWDGDKPTFSGPMHGGGMTANSRDTFTKAGKNEFSHEGEMEVEGKWMKLDKETCKRAK
jgi:hypothetical protein